MAVIESKGDGFSLFNGVKLPSLPSLPEYDTEKYKYALIRKSESGKWFLYITQKPFKFVNDGTQTKDMIGNIGSGSRYNLNADKWEYSRDYADTSNEDDPYWGYFPYENGFEWANHDILSTTDNSVYLAASEPIALDGMNVIEWDGDTEGLELFPNNTMFYHVSTATNIDTTKQYAAVRINTNNNSIRGVKGEFSTAEGYYSASTVGRYIDEISDNYPTAGIFMLNNSSKLITSLFAYYPIEEVSGDKTTISFNNKEYSIDTAALSPATSALKSHLSTVMNGTGAVINLGGTAYNVDSAKLTAATNAFVQHLGTIAGNGYKVVVGGVEYGVDAAKVAGAIAHLGATWEGTQTIGFPIIWNTKDVVGNTTVVFNEFQFVKVSDFAPSYEELAETILVISNDITTSVQSVESYGNNVLAGYHEVIIASISEAGEIPEFGITFPETGLYAIDLGSRGLDFDIGLWTSDLYPLNGEVYCYGDYKYTYNNGWSVDINEEVVDRNQASYGVILENIKGKPVTNMDRTFNGCSSLIEAPVIPASVTNMDRTFNGCSSLIEAPVIPASVTNMERTFTHCTDLIGAIEINANPSIYNACFDQVDMSNITLTGASTMLNEIGATGLNWTPIA